MDTVLVRVHTSCERRRVCDASLNSRASCQATTHAIQITLVIAYASKLRYVQKSAAGRFARSASSTSSVASCCWDYLSLFGRLLVCWKVSFGNESLLHATINMGMLRTSIEWW